MRPDPYASHLPVLRRFRPKRVLEFGAGMHSTAYFLSLPYLTRLVSVECDPEWRARMHGEFFTDRWELTTEYPDPKDFDLVFIDDGQEAEQRIETIRRVLDAPHPRVVIHDAEHYQEAIGDAPHIIYALERPWTAVVS